MHQEEAPGDAERVNLGRQLNPENRRNFLKWSGAAAATAFLAACDRSPTEPGADLSSSAQAQLKRDGGVEIDLSKDTGILNFAFALEQLEAAFYTKVIVNLYNGAAGEEESILRDIKRHEVVHREFLRIALGDAAIPALRVDFSSVDFASRESVLVTAKVLEDTGVGAYNGAAQFLDNTDFLFVAGKIVSVEARHASAIRDVLGRSFAPQAFDPALTFEQVLRRAAPFISTPITLTHSPTAHQAGAEVREEEMVS